MKKVRIGDVFEIRTCRGLAYVQYTHIHAEWGELIRGIPGFWSERPIVCGVVTIVSKYQVFVPLRAMITKCMLRFACNCPVPDGAGQFPVFRAHRHMPWLWDGEREWRYDQYVPEYGKYPIREILTGHDGLRMRIEKEWTNEMG